MLVRPGWLPWIASAASRAKAASVSSPFRPESIATQSSDELGGRGSVLERQKRDHITLDRLLHAVDGVSGDDRQELLARLCRLVFPHAFAEESVLWPVVRRVLLDGQELTLKIEQEHQEINALFTALEQTAPDDPRHRALWARIATLLREDVRDEEDVLLPKLQVVLRRRQLRALGMAWALVDRVAPTRPHPVVARRPPGNVIAAAPLTVIDRGRDHLDRWARRAPGKTGTIAAALSARLAGVAGLVERLPPLTYGEHPSTSRPTTVTREHDRTDGVGP